MKRTIAIILASLLLILPVALGGCSERSLLDPGAPVTLTMWHVYGEQADSPMNRLIEEFNRSVGRERGVIIDVTLMSSTAQIGEKLLSAKRGAAGAMEMPTCSFATTTTPQSLARRI